MFAALLCFAALGACSVEVDYGSTTFACSDGLCPDGYSCVATVCEADEQITGDPDAAIEPVPDAAPAVDAEQPDAEAQATCDELFGQAPGYQLCSEDDLGCSFNVSLEGQTCTAACLLLQSTCLGAFDNESIAPCAPIEATGDTCDTPRSSEICVCAR